jgi:hypothetical protein
VSKSSAHRARKRFNYGREKLQPTTVLFCRVGSIKPELQMVGGFLDLEFVFFSDEVRLTINGKISIQA